MKPLPIGISDFKKMINGGYLFVDTTPLIGEIFRDSSEIILLTRPRRFGKTLNMSMLSYFYDNRQKNETLFKGLKIAEDDEVMKQINQYPTIFLSFKDIKDDDWESAFLNIKTLISDLYDSFKETLPRVQKSKKERKIYQEIIDRTAPATDFKNSVKNLIGYLHREYNRPVLLLIDEYDVPIQSGWKHKYYENMIDFMQVFLSAALKDNPLLYKGILTGIYRVAKESIFSGLNNLSVLTVLDDPYSQYFGFTEEEVFQIAKERYPEESEKYLKDLREWYDGYTFGEHTMYNPWSVINYLQYGKLKPYWVNTSSNDLIIELIEQNLKKNQSFRKEIENLMNGEGVEKSIDDATALREIENNPQAIWALFLFSGYLKAEQKTLERGKLKCTLKIPNEEVKIFYQDIVLQWLNRPEAENLTKMLQCLIAGDGEGFGEKLKAYTQSTLSYYDIQEEAENTYHVLLLGILAQLQEKYIIRSNRESGFGRYDILLKPKDRDHYAAVIEIKNLPAGTKKAQKQIDEKDYTEELVTEGYEHILKVAVAVKGKKMDVKVTVGPASSRPKQPPEHRSEERNTRQAF